MPRKDYNWIIGCLTLVLTLTVLFGGQFLWNKYAVANPINDMFSNVEGIESVTIGKLHEQGKNSDSVKLFVKLKDVTDLQKLYSEINDGLRQIKGGKKYEIIIQDSRTPELEQFYYSIHYHIQEAVFTGNFANMAERIENKANSAGVNTKVFVDSQNVYLSITKGTAQMHIVAARASTNQGVK